MKIQGASLRVLFAGGAIGVVLLVSVPVTLVVFGLMRAGDYVVNAKTRAEIQRVSGSVQRAVLDMQKALPNKLTREAGSRSAAFSEAGEKAQKGLDDLKQLVKGNPEHFKCVQDAQAALSRFQGRVTKPGTEPKGQQVASSSSEEVALTAVQEPLLSLDSAQVAVADQSVASASQTLTNLFQTVLIAVVLFAAILLGLAAVLARYVARPLADAVSFAEAIQQGELSRRLAIKGFAEARALEVCLNTMAESLEDYNRRVLDGVNVLTGSVAQIAGTASEVLAGASQTVSAVNETTAVVHEMERGAKVVNDTARKVAEHSEQSDVIANSGTQATHDTLQKMNLIKEKMEIVNAAVVGLSDKTKLVESIISAVQDLADQSNLLAVNASIEAARAGEHGKGFAVVASEIKSLADQSRDATQKVSRTLQEIRSSVSAVVMATEEGGKAVMSGVEQSEAAGEAIQKLAESIGEFSQAAGIIFASSGKQFSRVERIGTAMKNVELAMNSSMEGTTHVENEAKRLEGLARTLTGLVRQHQTAVSGH